MPRAEPPSGRLLCSTLHDACLHVGPPQPSCSRDCREPRAFRITAHGRAAVAEVAALLKERRMLRDPLNSFKLRHLERDIFASNRTAAANATFRGSMHLFWPRWENGHSDMITSLLLPLGYLLYRGELPRGQLGLSGVRHARVVAPLRHAAPLCTFERASPPLPRCRSACYASLAICQPRFPTHTNAYLATAALDEFRMMASTSDADARKLARAETRWEGTDLDDLSPAEIRRFLFVEAMRLRVAHAAPEAIEGGERGGERMRSKVDCSRLMSSSPAPRS